MIFDKTNFPGIPESWARIPFELGCTNLPIAVKVKTSDYLQSGLLPVVDQGGPLVGGYINNAGVRFDARLPLVIFGDHTRNIKYINFPFAAGADGIKILEPSEAFEPRAFFYFVRAIRLPDKGYARHFQYLRASDLPLPPLNEQRRIASKLDTTLAAVDACRQRLDGVAELLKRFRQAVLAAATSGELTREWREEKGKRDSMEKVSLGEVIIEMRNGLSPKPAMNPPGVKILRIGAVRSGSVDWEDHRYLALSAQEAKSFGLQEDDLLFTRYNGTLEFVGVCARVGKISDEYVYPDKLIRARCDPGKALPAYVEIAFGANSVRSQVEGCVKSSAGQKGISGGDLKGIRFSLPSIEEQQEIIRRAQDLFTLADQLEARLNSARRVVDRLTPALLAKAFRGELVPQDPNDEPASMLLERLAAKRVAARQAEAAAGKPSRRGRKPAAAHPEQARLGLESMPAVASDPLPPDQLAQLLQDCGPLSEKALLAASDLEPGSFLRQLQLELQAGTIREALEEWERVLVGG